MYLFSRKKIFALYIVHRVVSSFIREHIFATIILLKVLISVTNIPHLSVLSATPFCINRYGMQ